MNDYSPESAAPLSNGTWAVGEGWDGSGGVVRRRGLVPLQTELGMLYCTLFTRGILKRVQYFSRNGSP